MDARKAEPEIINLVARARPECARIDLSGARSSHAWRNKLARVLWTLTWGILFRTSPTPFHAWRRLLLRAFGARIAVGAEAYPTCKIWAPWNLSMGPYSTLAGDVDCYCVAPVRLGAHATVSQYSFLCTASHDYTQGHLPLTTAPIEIGDGAWIAADVFIAPGVSVGEGSVVGACARVFKDIPPWVVAGGHPARVLKRRVLSTPSHDLPEP